MIELYVSRVRVVCFASVTRYGVCEVEVCRPALWPLCGMPACLVATVWYGGHNTVWYGGIALRALRAVKVSGALYAPCAALNSLHSMHQQGGRWIE